MSEERKAPKPPDNIEFKRLPKVSWEPDQRRESLQEIADYVATEAASAIDWYLRKKTRKQWPAKILRSLAIGATALAGLIPMLAEIFTTESGVPSFSPVWASVALLVAATCVGIDRFFGFSSAWMRFLTTEMQIRRALHDFLLDWETRRAGWDGKDLGAQQAEAGLQHCKTFLAEVNDILKAEMDTWVTEFRAAVADIDRAAKAQAQVMRLGAANITVTNGEECQDGWQLSVDGGAPTTRRGTSSAVRNLAAGSHMVTVAGRIGAADKRAEMAFTVADGATADVSLTLA